MVLLTEETRLRRAALVLCNEPPQRAHPRERRAAARGPESNGQVHLGRPELRRALSDWAAGAEIDEATLTLRRLPQDALYDRVRSHLEQIMGPPVFATAKQPGR
jgi:hypothetical protein